MASLIVTLGLVAATVLPQSRTPPNTTAARPRAPDVRTRGFTQQQRIMPNLIGLSEEAARDTLERLRIRLDSVRYLQTAAAGPSVVVRQLPMRGTVLARGTRVEIFVNEAQRAPPVVVPNLRTLSENSARATLDQVGLVVGGTVTRPSPLPSGTVIDQTPAPGDSVEAGTAVDLVLAVPVPAPPPPAGDSVRVPDLVGLSQADARQALGAARLTFSIAGVDTVEAGVAESATVRSQDPGPNTLVEPGTVVRVRMAFVPAATPPIIPPGPRQDEGPRPPPDRNWFWLMVVLAVLALAGAWLGLHRVLKRRSPPPPSPKPPHRPEPPVPHITARLAEQSRPPEAAVVAGPRTGMSVRFAPHWDPGVQRLVEYGPDDSVAGGSHG